MRSKLIGYVIALTVGFGLSSVAVAQPKNRSKGSDSLGDKSIEKQSEWENKVMGDDATKRAEMKKIAAAQKLAADAAKNPPPVAAPKVKDPNKEGVRAKQEASIGLPIASDSEAQHAKKAAGPKKAAPAPNSANDELGALVASSLAEDKGSDASASSSAKGGNRTKGGFGSAKGKGHAKAGGGGSSSLDQMFAADK
jgi:hypothetical protein